MAERPQSVLIVGELTPRSVRLARKLGTDVVAYEGGSVPLDSAGVTLRRVSISQASELLGWERVTREAVRAFCRRHVHQIETPLRWLGLTSEVFGSYFEQWFCRQVQDDYRLVLIGKALFPGAQVTHVFRRPSLLALLVAKAQIAGAAETTGRTESLKHLMAPAWLLVWLSVRRRPREKAHLVFELLFAVYENNVEQESLDRVIKRQPWNCLYLVTDRRTRLYRELKESGCAVLSLTDLRLEPSIVAKGVLAWLRTVIWTSSRGRLGWAAALSYGRLVFTLFKYRALANTVECRFFLKTRSDLDICSGIIRQELNAHNVQTISYSHATYFKDTQPPAALDFDYYGYSGQSELELFAAVRLRQRVGKYIRAGQMSVEGSRRKMTDDLVAMMSKGSVLGVYPTTVCERTLGLTSRHLQDFIATAVKCAARWSMCTVIVKAKTADGELERLTAAHAADAGINLILAHHHVTKTGYRRLTALESYELISAGVVLSESTCAFELLALQKRVLVYEPIRPADHPFSKYTPLLVAADPASFEASFDELMAISDEEYRDYISPTLEYCGRRADGRMVESFLTAVDGLITPADEDERTRTTVAVAGVGER